MSKRSESPWIVDRLQVAADHPKITRFKRWVLIVLISLSVGMVIGAEMARSAEDVIDTGYINNGTRICESITITPTTVEIFERYKTLIDKLEAVGFENLTKLERHLGGFLTFDFGCGTVAEDYRVNIIRIAGEYALFVFDEGYGFDKIIFILTLDAFFPDERIYL